MRSCDRQMCRRARNATGMSNSQDDQIGRTAMRDIENFFGGIALLNKILRRAPDFRFGRHQFVEPPFGGGY